MRLYTFRKTKLGQGSPEVLPAVSGLEIDIALKIIGEKPQPQLKGDQADGLVEIAGIVIYRKS